MEITYIAFLVAIAVSAASAGYIEDGCNQVICKETGLGLSHANPRDKCSFCCCFHDDNLGKPALYRDCPGDSSYDPVTRSCKGHGCKPAENCEDMICTSEDSFPSPKDSCTFCCCREDGGPKTTRCPASGGFYGQYDPNQGRCVTSNSCGTTIGAQFDQKQTKGGDGCMIMQPYCPIPEHKHATICANPWDSRSYCVCDWGKIHWMPCAPGTTFDDAAKVCV